MVEIAPHLLRAVKRRELPGAVRLILSGTEAGLRCGNNMRTLILLAGLVGCLQGQWLNYPNPRTPRTKDGKPNLTAPVARLNGKLDLSGLWQAERT